MRMNVMYYSHGVLGRPIRWEWVWCITHMESLQGLLDENECDVLLTWSPWKACWMRMSVMYYSHGVLGRPIRWEWVWCITHMESLEGLLDENECDVLLTWGPWKAYWMRMSVMYYSHGVLGRPIWMRMSVMYYSHGVLGRPIGWEWVWCITHMESLEGLLDENECDVLPTWSPWKAYWMRMSVMYYSHGVLGRPIWMRMSVMYYSHGVLARPIGWEWVWCITHMESLEGLLDENECDVLLTWSPCKAYLDENECDVLLTWSPWKAYWMRMSVMYYSHGVLGRPIGWEWVWCNTHMESLEGLLDENECDVLLTWSPWKAYWMRMNVM